MQMISAQLYVAIVASQARPFMPVANSKMHLTVNGQKC